MKEQLDGRFFRHEYGRLVSMLTRRVGAAHVAAVEDAVQVALLKALESWLVGTVPKNPSAWLFRVAHNEFLARRRQASRQEALALRNAEEILPGEDAPKVILANEVRDDLVRMLFVCCDDAIPVESQIVLALKTLCGFDVREIAERLFTTEANVYKRLARARGRLRELPLAFDDPTPEQLTSRLAAVQSILYLLFTEGYLSSHAEGPLRRDLCDEAIRLGDLVAEHRLTATPTTFALVALMHLHAARMPSRQDDSGGLLLLEEQDRSLWSQEAIRTGLRWLARSAEGEVFSRYHAEAGIAAEHCVAPSFRETRWERIVAHYELLEKLAPSMLHTLNRAVATAEARGPEQGLALLDGLEPPSWLAGSYLWSAVLADLHLRCGHSDRGRRYAYLALASAPSDAIRAALQRRLSAK